jgi:16S rRNA G966 N2-methylase RsmD
VQQTLPTDAKPRIDVDGIFPFSILRSDRGIWQNRKKAWAELGFDSQAGREGVKTWDTSSPFGKQQLMKISNGLSTFDPVLAEVSYEWYVPPNGRILDPFAGGSVRGLVAGHGAYDYLGVDLSARQVEANEVQVEDWQQRGLIEGSVEYITGDATDVVPKLTDESFDYVFTCPPYHDLEVYSDAPDDLSNMEWDDFVDAYTHVIAESARTLKSDRFATWVVGDLRDRKGNIRGLVPLTIAAHEAAGMHLYNDQILQNVLGTVPLRVGNQWRASRKMGRHHQYVLTFVKGDAKKATRNITDPGTA